MRRISDITGAIMAGGKSSRFGENKAFAGFNGVPLVARVLQVFQGIFDDVVIVTNTPEIYSYLGVPVITDILPHRGPLGGIMTALEHSKGLGVFAAACDMPLLSPDVIRRIVEMGMGHQACVPHHDGVKEYLMAYYSGKLFNQISHLVRAGKLSVAGLCDLLTDVTWVPVEGNSWVNVNTKEELQLLESYAS